MNQVFCSEDELRKIIKDVISQHLPGINNSAPAPEIEIIDTKTLCKRLSISEPTAIRYRAKRKIPFLEIGTVIRYNWPAVVESLEKKAWSK